MSTHVASAESTGAIDEVAVGEDSRPWEVVLYHREGPRSGPRVAGCLHFDAANAAAARRIAEEGLARRADGDPYWALGPLRPLCPSMPGTLPYRVTFAMWRDRGDGFTREDVFVTTQWATDARCARCFAIRQAQADPTYQGAWRVRETCRIVDRDEIPERGHACRDR